MNRLKPFTIAAALWVAVWWFLIRDELAVERVGPRPSPGSKVVLLLHGSGSSGDDLVSVARELSSSLPRVTFLMPTGPARVGLTGHSWISTFSAPAREELVRRGQAEVEATIAKLWRVIESAQRHGVACQDITVGGFSQRGRLALQVALTAPLDCQLGSLLVMSGAGLAELPMPPAEGHDAFGYQSASLSDAREGGRTPPWKTRSAS